MILKDFRRLRRKPIPVGSRFGRLIVTGWAYTSRTGNAMCNCRCDCGREKQVRATSLRKGYVASCGCLGDENRKKSYPKHGACCGVRRGGGRSGAYKSWTAMWQRCTNPNHFAHERYAPLGVCEKWRSFTSFLDDMGDRPAGTSIDRIDNERGYEPGNCRWATHRQQQRNNQRTRRITANGQTKLLCEWAEETGIRAGTIRERLRAGWSPERAVSR